LNWLIWKIDVVNKKLVISLVNYFPFSVSYIYNCNNVYFSAVSFFFIHMAAPPSVSNVRMVGDAVEGITIKGVGDYFGGREGPSKFEWLRKNRETGSVFSSS
jgi:hypothetical protein